MGQFAIALLAATAIIGLSWSWEQAGLGTSWSGNSDWA
jgi:hypothetical protein